MNHNIILFNAAAEQIINTNTLDVSCAKIGVDNLIGHNW